MSASNRTHSHKLDELEHNNPAITITMSRMKQLPVTLLDAEHPVLCTFPHRRVTAFTLSLFLFPSIVHVFD